MRINNKLVGLKIEFKNQDCRGVYYVADRTISTGVVTSSPRRFKEDTFQLFILGTKKIENKRVQKKKLVTYQAKEFTLFKAVEDAQKQRASFVYEKQKDQDNEKKLETVNDIWDWYYDLKTNGNKQVKQWKPSTAKDAKSFFDYWIRGESKIKERSFLPSKLGKKKFSDLKRKDISSFMESMEGVSERTRRKVIDYLRACFADYIYMHEIDKSNPATFKNLPKLDNAREIHLTIEQVRALWKAIDDSQHESKYFFTWLRTGRRVNELLTLEFNQVHENYYELLPEHTKSKTRQLFIVREDMKDALKGKQRTHVFTSFRSHKTKLSIDSLRSPWQNILKSSGLDELKFSGSRLHMHDLRHIISGLLKEHLVPEDIRSAVLGHANASVTERYTSAEATMKAASKAIEFLNDVVYSHVPEGTEWGTQK